MGSVGHRIVLLGLGVVLIGVVLVAHQAAAIVQLVQETWRTLPPLPRFEVREEWARVLRALYRFQLVQPHNETMVHLYVGTALVLTTIVIYTLRNWRGVILSRLWLAASCGRVLHVLRRGVDTMLLVPFYRQQRKPALSILPVTRHPFASSSVVTNVSGFHSLPVICDEDQPVAECSLGGIATPLPKLEITSRPILSDREREIVGLLAQGYSNLQIAAELTITVLTVKRHLSNIYGKLHVNDRRTAVENAQRFGLV